MFKSKFHRCLEIYKPVGTHRWLWRQALLAVQTDIKQRKSLIMSSSIADRWAASLLAMFKPKPFQRRWTDKMVSPVSPTVVHRATLRDAVYKWQKLRTTVHQMGKMEGKPLIRVSQKKNSEGTASFSPYSTEKLSPTVSIELCLFCVRQQKNKSFTCWKY